MLLVFKTVLVTNRDESSNSEQEYGLPFILIDLPLVFHRRAIHQRVFQRRAFLMFIIGVCFIDTHFSHFIVACFISVHFLMFIIQACIYSLILKN